MRSGAFLIFIFTAAMAQASEQAESIEACEQVMELYAQELEANGREIDLSNICQNNIQPLSYWQCANERMINGETFLYATGQCGGSQS